MNDFRYKIARFMSGRYGIDPLFFVMFAIAAALAIVNSFLRLVYLQFAVYAVMILALLRMFSRNTVARRKENDAIFGLFGRIKNRYDVYIQRKRDTTHVYRKCPYCKAMLRLPRKKGKHKTVCPRCNCDFTVRVIK